jgi:DNA-binding transcriptional LysR family regulator
VDRVDAMTAFVAVVDRRGFAAAARALRISPSTVTRLVAGLEEHLGIRLLTRTTRSVTLTGGGARYL